MTGFVFKTLMKHPWFYAAWLQVVVVITRVQALWNWYHDTTGPGSPYYHVPLNNTASAPQARFAITSDALLRGIGIAVLVLLLLGIVVEYRASRWDVLAVFGGFTLAYWFVMTPTLTIAEVHNVPPIAVVMIGIWAYKSFAPESWRRGLHWRRSTP